MWGLFLVGPHINQQRAVCLYNGRATILPTDTTWLEAQYCNLQGLQLGKWTDDFSHLAPCPASFVLRKLASTFLCGVFQVIASFISLCIAFLRVHVSSSTGPYQTEWGIKWKLLVCILLGSLGPTLLWALILYWVLKFPFNNLCLLEEPLSTHAGYLHQTLSLFKKEIMFLN